VSAQPLHAPGAAGRGRIERAAIAILRALIRLYQITLSPFVGRFCRFTPTCSRYFDEALVRHGLARGFALGCRRILRCRPFGGSGFDPVPDPDAAP
jgi:putative membrane protein insertion efficiency factor